ncbi:UDP-glucuronosyltransferase [Methylomonas sp. LL1]|uniref:glycosyltransferase n=1 Tax=Methylomonas sp. LL1 TaxID=2785785 RepID=UPI0018C370D8|nr:nucleotide disphospho-sugar-binding domain-containing protein [Methylomonas sp. LL1]QPK64526.1 UDP-glucuronosyltransferase [Methylomonas sp. LL1]
MSRILFAWELGANYGHLTRQLPIAEKLRKQGHAVFFAVRDTTIAARLLEPLGFAYTQAPFDTANRRPVQPPANYAEILLASGYADPPTLCGMVRGWLSLIRLLRADSVVIDHAPTALFAAYLAGLPAAVIGTGFEIPPDRSPLPSIRPWDNIGLDRLQQAEEKVLDRLNPLTVSSGRPKLQRISELFRYASIMLASFAELDHYGVRDGQNYDGPLSTDFSGQQESWREPDKPHIFAYLRPSLPGFELLLRALSKQAAEVIVIAPGIRRSQAEALATNRFRLHTQPIALNNGLLQSADLAVSYAGAGTVNTCLLAGVPMLLLPQNVEQYLMSRCVETIGAGIAAKQTRNETQFSELLEQALHTPAYRQQARAFAQRHAGFNPEQTLNQTVRMIEELLPDRKANEQTEVR